MFGGRGGGGDDVRRSWTFTWMMVCHQLTPPLWLLLVVVQSRLSADERPAFHSGVSFPSARPSVVDPALGPSGGRQTFRSSVAGAEDTNMLQVEGSTCSYPIRSLET